METRLLVIDDEPSVQKLVKAVLTRADYKVVTAGSGTECLKLLGDQDFDCVITDAVMPVMSGYDLVRAIRRLPDRGDIPVLMLTRMRHRLNVKNAVEAGVTDYVLKPIDEHLLLDKVELCLTKGGGKRHVREVKLAGAASSAEIRVSCSVVALSESDLTLRTAMPWACEFPFQLCAGLFEEIGIAVPVLKLLKCDKAEESALHKDLPFEVKLSFVGVQEQDLMKIRNWLRKQEIRLRK